MDVREVLAHLLAGGTLTRAEAREVFTRLLSGELDPAQIGALLALIQARPGASGAGGSGGGGGGPTSEELAGAGTVMREHVTPVERPAGMETLPVLDTCGTGGTPKTFNISTAAAIVAAAAQGESRAFLVAKHGNRSRSGRGSAEVLERLGVNVHASPAVQTRCLRDVGVCFCFSVNHHPAMKHAGPARLALGFPTIFNLLGPLTNPARADRQLMGVFAPRYIAPMARALKELGSTRALVLHSDDGMDEISTCAPTRGAELRGGVVREGVVFEPGGGGELGVGAKWSNGQMVKGSNGEEEDGARVVMGVARASVSDLTVSTLDEAADAVRGVLAGEPGPKLDAVLVNTAAALVVGGSHQTYADAFAAAGEAIASGRAMRTLNALAQASRDA